MNPNDTNNPTDPVSTPGAAPVGDQPVPPIPTLQQDNPIVQPINTSPVQDNSSALPSFGAPSFGDTNFTAPPSNPTESSALPPAPGMGSDLPFLSADQPLQPTAGQSDVWAAASPTPVDQPNFSADSALPNTDQIPPQPQENVPAFGAGTPAGQSQPNWNTPTPSEVAQQPVQPMTTISTPEPAIGANPPIMDANTDAGLGNVLDQNPLGSPSAENPVNQAPFSGLDQTASPAMPSVENVSQTPAGQENTVQSPGWLPPVSSPEIMNSTPASSPTMASDLNSGVSDGATGLNESVPTDLSHLIDNSTAGNPAGVQPETIIVPSASDENQVVTTKESGGFPKWLFAVGAVILIGVIAASAYFILGIGKNEVSQIPEEQPLPTVAPPVVIPTIPPLNTSTPSGEANFSNLGGEPAPNEATASPSPAGGSSAMDRIKSRVSPTPVLEP